LCFYQIGLERALSVTNSREKGTNATPVPTTLSGHVISKGGATTTLLSVAASVVVTTCAPTPTTALLVPLLVPPLISSVHRRTRDDKVLDGRDVNCWPTSLCGWLHLEGQCRHLLGQRSNMLIQRLLVCHDCIDCRRQFSGDDGSLVSITQGASRSLGCGCLCHCRFCTGIVAVIQNMIHALGDISLLARHGADVGHYEFTRISAVDGRLENRPRLILDGIPLLELLC
jgi:hypothetical protein